MKTITAFKLEEGQEFVANGVRYVCTGNDGGLIYGQSLEDSNYSITLFPNNEVQIHEQNDEQRI